MLVQLTELPVDGEDVHVVVLLEVVGQQVQRVISSLQALLVLEDLLHLDQDMEQMLIHTMVRKWTVLTSVYLNWSKRF